MKLKRYQKEGIKFAIQHNGRILLGDEMGVGKTLQAICISVVYHSDWPLLILCPSSLKLNWQDELLKWIPEGKEKFNINSKDIHILHKNKDSFLPNKKVSSEFIRIGVHYFIRYCYQENR
jgi:SNF2 family DNA or RNA helicase